MANNGIPSQAGGLLARARRLLHDHRTRARKDGATLDYGLRDLRQLIAAHPLCEYCRMPVGWDVSLDHRTPIGRGGKHELANLVVCCRRCNALKGQLDAEEFGRLLTLLRDMHAIAHHDLVRRLLAGGKRYAGGRQRSGATRKV